MSGTPVSAATIVLVGSNDPIPTDAGRGWLATEGEPRHLRVVFPAPGQETPSADEFGAGSTVWIGTQIDELQPAGDLTEATALLCVGQEGAPGHEAEFNEWLDAEHVPGLAAVDGTLSAHRYHNPSPPDGQPSYFAVYHLRDADVRAAPEWKAVGQSELSERMKPYARKRVRGFYRPGD